MFTTNKINQLLEIYKMSITIIKIGTLGMKKLLLSSLALSAITLADAKAETTSQEFSAINKVASLCQSFKSNGINVAIITSSTATDTAKIENFAKSAGLKASTVDIANISSTNANLIIVANGVSSAEQDKVRSTFEGKQVITASTDLTCVESGKCMLGVDIGSVVKLLVNSNNYSASGLKFDPAFEFMVKQI